MSEFDEMKTEFALKYTLTCKDITAIREDCGKTVDQSMKKCIIISQFCCLLILQLV